MSEPTDPDRLPQATVVPPKRRRLSVIWIIPILAALVAIGVAVERILSQGPTITIVFSAAEGIEAGKTFVKFKDVNIGQVTAVRLTPDYNKVEVTARIDKYAARLMVEDAKFWVVQPQISLSGISGLGTLLSGNYIGLEPGTSKQAGTAFTGLDVAPVAAGRQGRQFVLDATELGSLSVGSPVTYRQLRVGEVTDYDFSTDGKAVRIKIFVNSPYDRFVTSATRFWNVSGINVSLGADGVIVRTESLVALIAGGLAFDAPSFADTGVAAEPGAVFTIYRDLATAMKAPDPIAARFVLHFSESLRGLSVGAPVTFLGLPVGEVAEVGLEYRPEKGDIRQRVVVTFFGGRWLAYAPKDQQGIKFQSAEERRELARRLVDQGMRAQLKSGSLLTGQLYVSFDYYTNAPKAKADFSQAVPELPVVPSALADIETKLGTIVDKIGKIPLEAIGNDLKKDLENLDQSLVATRKLITNADEQLVPGLKTAVDDAHRMLVTLERAGSNANSSLLQSNSATQEELRAALQEFTGAARSLRVLLDSLERQPSSLIRGKSEATSGGR